MQRLVAFPRRARRTEHFVISRVEFVFYERAGTSVRRWDGGCSHQSFRAPTSHPELTVPSACRSVLILSSPGSELLRELHCRYPERPGPIQFPDCSDKSYGFDETGTF